MDKWAHDITEGHYQLLLVDEICQVREPTISRVVCIAQNTKIKWDRGLWIMGEELAGVLTHNFTEVYTCKGWDKFIRTFFAIREVDGKEVESKYLEVRMDSVAEKWLMGLGSTMYLGTMGPQRFEPWSKLGGAKPYTTSKHFVGRAQPGGNKEAEAQPAIPEASNAGEGMEVETPVIESPSRGRSV